MRHSIAVHNEAASMVPDAMASVYLNEAFADSRYVVGGRKLFRGALLQRTPWAKKVGKVGE